jgi:Uma2 family endonuclease
LDCEVILTFRYAESKWGSLVILNSLWDNAVSTFGEVFMIVTMADLLHQLGDVSPARVRFRPPPGTATEQDVLAIHASEKRLCELIDGTLVEKATGLRESFLALHLSFLLLSFIRARKLGIVAGADGMLKLSSGLVRIPDISFISWDRIPGGKVPREPIPQLAPTLAVEVLSEGNTTGELDRKRHEYFEAGVSQVWIVDPVARTVALYTNFDECTTLAEADTLNGGGVLPGFALPLHDLFSELDQTAS